MIHTLVDVAIHPAHPVTQCLLSIALYTGRVWYCFIFPTVSQTCVEATSAKHTSCGVQGRDGKVASSDTTASAAAIHDDPSAEHGRRSSDDGSINSGGVAGEQRRTMVAARSKELEGLFLDLYPGNEEEDGLKTSRNERLSKGYESITLTYGEVSAAGVRRF